MIPERVIDRVRSHAHSDGDCIISDYSTGSHGYAQVGWHDDGRRRMTLCHRIAWIAEHGPIPDGLTVDHICRVRKCVNPAHLRLLTNVDNARDNGFATRTHCPAGHPYDLLNTYVNRKGSRICRECGRARRRNS